MLKTKLLQWKLCFVIVVVLLTNHICTGDVILSELWGRANAIGYVIDDVFPKWYYHRYDGDSVAMNSINDGGEDLFDIGNKVHYFEGSDAPGDPLTYGNSYEYRTSSIHVGTTSHPFLTLAWIENQEGIHTNYTIQVDSNLGTDGSGAITQFNGTMENDVNGSVYLEYQVFQVYNADGRDPTYCEVYFAIAYEKWNSTFITSNLRFNMLLNGTDSILNAATLDGAIQNVAFGYALLTVENGQLVSMENIEEFLNQLMLLMIDEETPPAHLVSGECDDTIYLNGTTTTTMFHPLSITGARNCEITIQALFGYKIDAILNVSFPNGYLQIYDRSSRLKIIYRYGNNICVSTTGDVLRLRYYSYYTNPPLLGSREGITATYKQYVSTCGQEVQASSSEQTITLIGSSGSDVNHDDCFWRIRPGFRSIKLVIKQLVLDDVNDYLQICEDFEKVKRIESNITTPITLYGVEFGIRYRGGSKSSLVATYQDYTCDQTYQLKVNEEFAIVTSSMLGIIGDDVDSYRCLWSFKSQPGYYLIVDVKAEEYTLLRSTIYAYDNKTNTRWHPYGNSKGYLSSSGFLRLGFRYSRESTPQLYVTYKQFKPSCGELLNATSLPQTISIDAGNPSDCFWNISGTLINLTINDLQLESDDYLEVYEGPYLISRINETLSASVTLLTRTSLGMIILYHKTSIHGIISAVYTKESCDQTYQPNNSSTRTVQLRIPSILFHQPNYWHLHYHRTTCNIYFEADEDHAVIMDYQSLHRSGYRYNIRVYENFTDIGSYNSYVRYPPYIPTMRWEWVSSRSIIHLQLSLRFYFNQYTSNNFYNNLNLATIANINPKQETI